MAKSVAGPKIAKAAAGKRGPGRPQASKSRSISRTTILRSSMKLAKTVPLQELSIVSVAKTMNVTSALIHYYIGGRDWLTSGIMNLFYKELMKKWPDVTGDWQVDIAVAARYIFEHFADYGGISAYAVSNSRFRIFQLTAFGDRDYGVEMLDRFTGLVRKSGLPSDRTGIYTNQLMEFIINTAHSTAQHIFPSEHRAFLEDKSAKLDNEKYPNISFAKQGPLNIDGQLAFQEGCNLYLLGMTAELKGVSVAQTIGNPALIANNAKKV